MSSVIGIDPGVSGAIAMLADGEVSETMILPRIGEGHHDWRAIAEWIEDRPKIDLAVLEHVHAIGGKAAGRTSSPKGAFTFGGSFHGLEAVLQLLQVPYQLVRPQQWKKVVLQGFDKSRKDSSVQFVQRRWPHVNLLPTERSRKASDALADAICLAHYGQLYLQGKAS